MHYLIQLKPTRLAMLSDGPTDEESAVVAEHFQYLQQLTDTGKVLLAGRTLTTDASSVGLVIIETQTQAEAEQIMHHDPAVLANVMSATLSPYRIALWNTAGPSF